MGRAIASFVLGLAACIEPQLTECPDGRACPRGSVCDDVHHSCVEPEQLAACAGASDGTPCTAGTIVGMCFDQVCLRPGCGNGVVEPGEQCDDGNQSSGDGCNSTCTSTETCGNGIVDLERGERCDDGNLASHDGCDSRCQIETPVWRAFPITQPVVETGFSAFDRARGRLVYSTTTATWEWDGMAWQIVTIAGPTPLALVYDSSRQRVALIGSDGVATWNGTSWEPSGGGAPPMAPLLAAAYDASADRIVVLVGGALVDYDPATATWDTPRSVPFVIDSRVQCTFDVARGRLVVIVPGPPAMTYEWDGATWTPYASAPGTPSWTLTYDAGRNAVFAAGGVPLHLYTWTNGTWGDNGLLSNGTNPTLWYDSTSGQLVLDILGGGVPEMWTWRGGVMVDISPHVPLHAGNLLYDPVHDQLLLPSIDSTDWLLVGGVWQSRNSTQPPPYVTNGIFDPVRGGVIEYDAVDNVTWLDSDTGWQQLAVSPAGEVPTALVYDYDARRVLMIGDSGTYGLDSSGDAWTAIAATNTPRGATSGAYDFGYRRPVVLDNNDTLGDFLGDHWVTSLSPGGGYVAAATAARRSILLVPLQGGSNPPLLWERHLSSWTSIEMPPVPIEGSGLVVTERSYGRIDIVTTAYAASVVLERQLVSGLPDETCEPGVDADGDGLAGCDDPDCWWACHPQCPYQSTCP